MYPSAASKPLPPEAEELIQALMASGAYETRDSLLHAALRALAGKAKPETAEARLDAVLDGIGDAFYALDAGWRFIIINRAAEAYYGRGRETMLGRSLWEVFPGVEDAKLASIYRRAMTTREPAFYEGESAGVPGRTLEVRLFPFGEGLGVSFRDWTEQRRAESALRESEGRLRLAVEAGRLAVWEIDIATEALKSSPELNEILGYPRDEPLDLSDVRQRYGPGDRERMRAVAQETLAQGERHFQVEYRFLRPDGAWIWLLLRAEVFFGAQGPEKVVGVVLDITERKQAEEALRESETRLEIAAAATDLGIWDWDLATGRMIYSDRAKAIYGFPLEGEVTFEMVRDATHPEDLPRTSALSQRALDPALREKVPYEYRIRWPDGEERWIVAHGDAVFTNDPTGTAQAVRYVGTIQDVTERKRAAAALRETEARLSALTDNLPSGMVYQVIVSADQAQRRFTYVSGSCERVNGVSAEEVLEDAARLYAIFPPDYAEIFAARELEAIAQRKPFDVEAPARHLKTGQTRWYRFLSAPRPLPNGETVWDGLQIDITERKTAEDAVRQSEERLRAVLDEMPVGVILARIPGGELLFQNAHASGIIGQPLGPSRVAQLISEYGRYGAIHPDGTPYRSEEYPIARTVLTGEDIDREDLIYRRPDGETIHLEISSAPMRWASGEAFAVSAFYDVTERKQAEEHQRLLINELNHRVKNTLATVQSIAAQSLRPLEGPAGELVARARASFEARLFALARAHDVLTRENWGSAALHDIVSEAAAPYRAGAATGPDAFVIEGPVLRLNPQMALSLSMALHELATNATKYGALSRPGGSVRIVWSTPDTPDGRRLRLLWQERGGPPVFPPIHKGFGTRLIERGLARELGGTVQLIYDAPGLRCTVDAPLGT